MGGETTEMSATTTRVVVESAHWDAVAMFRTGKRHKLTSEAGKRNERGVDPTICEAAADRVAELLAEHGGGTIEPGVTVVGTPPAPADGARSPTTSRPGSPASPSTPRPPSSALEAIGLLARQGRHRRHRHRAAVASRPDRPLRPGRGGRPDRRLLRGALGAAAGAARPRTDPRAAPAPPGRPHAGRRRLRRGGRASRSWATPPSTRSACPPTTRAATRCGWPTRSRPRSRRTPRRCCPGLLAPAARNLGRGADGRRRCSRPAPSPSRSTAARRRSTASTGARATTSSPSCSPRIPEQPLHLAVVLAGERERGGWWGERPRGRLGGRDRPGAPPRRRARRRRSRWPPPSRTPWHPGPLRARSASGGARARPRRRAAPAGVRGLRPARRARPPSRSTSTC